MLYTFLFSLLSFSCFAHIVTCQYVSIQAPTQVNYHRDKLPFACIPSGVGGTDSISDITLQKNYSTGWQDVVKVYLDVSTGQFLNKVTWTDINISQRASVNMSVVSPTTGAGLRIEISADNVACDDEGNYRCAISGNRAGGGKLDSHATPARVGLLVQAYSIESLQVNPRMLENIYNPGTPVTLTCTGDVGNPAGDLRWCIKREGIDISFTGYPNPSDISQGSAMLSGCQYRRSSTLTYNVSSTIPEVDFRCETSPLATCGLSSTIAANFTIIRHTEPVYTGSQISPFTEPANTVSQSSPLSETNTTRPPTSSETATTIVTGCGVKIDTTEGKELFIAGIITLSVGVVAVIVGAVVLYRGCLYRKQNRAENYIDLKTSNHSITEPYSTLNQPEYVEIQDGR